MGDCIDCYLMLEGPAHYGQYYSLGRGPGPRYIRKLIEHEPVQARRQCSCMVPDILLAVRKFSVRW